MSDHSTSQKDDTTSVPRAERRRPGRVEYTNRALIALLRGLRGNPTDATKSDIDAEADDLMPAKGIMLASALGAILLAAIGVVVWLVIG